MSKRQARGKTIKTGIIVLAAALVLAFGVMALAGCSSDNGSGSTGTSTDTSSTANSTDNSASMTDTSSTDNAATSATDNSSATTPTDNNEQVFVTVKVDITAAVEANDPTAVALASEKGGDVYTVDVYDSSLKTVLDATSAAGLTLSTASSSMGQYVTAIDGVASGISSASAGWTYDINGVAGTDSVDAATIQAGDVITWTYVTSWD
ncbi:MAG: DUF4430 domain-containing protein [Coriobacteriia bacterium]|nr:DUF4430 domain-containing protein [Coriobacteriia bacterium]